VTVKKTGITAAVMLFTFFRRSDAV